jgi:pyruvate dehydrogenase E2 component (dihydrolipoamide acetyltransferase)
MAISVVMPALEMAQETGKLVSWLKKEGDRVSKGELLLEVETDKAVMEIESPGDGVLVAIKAQPGAEIQVGKTIAWIVQPGEQPPAEEAETPSGRKITAAAATPVPAVSSKPAASKLRISPKARRLAKELGVDLSAVRGTGPEGEILADDVTGAASSSSAGTLSAETSDTFALTSVARLMAERTAQSWTTVPHFFVLREIDAEALNAARKHFAASTGPTKLTLTDLLVSIIACTLTKHPRLYASWKDGQIRRNSDINISLAIGVEGGVVAPVIRNADRLTLGAIAEQRTALLQRARDGKLRPADLADGTFTISNLGMFDVDAFTAIITPPQSAILAVSAIKDRVVAVNSQPAVRPGLTLSLSSDHRLIDGVTAAQFMQDLVQHLLAPMDALRNMSK